MDKVRCIQVLIAVVENGSFVAGAERIHISKAAASRHIQELENDLNVRLLQRSTRRISLTEAGESYYKRTKELLAELDNIDSLIGYNNNNPVGHIRINAPLAFGSHYLAHFWPEFLEKYPSVTLDVELNDRRVDLIEEGVDLAVRIGDMADSTLIYRNLSKIYAVACASPKYIEKYGKPVIPDDLEQHQIISYSYLPTGDVWNFTNESGENKAISLKPRMYSNNAETIRSVILAGEGIALQPSFLVKSDIEAGKLINLFSEWSGPEFNVQAVYPTRKYLSKKSGY